MNITVKYFGQIAEITKTKSEVVSFSNDTVSELMVFLYTMYPELKNKSFKVAQNQKLVFNNDKLTGAEIALLPPFAGG